MRHMAWFCIVIYLISTIAYMRESLFLWVCACIRTGLFCPLAFRIRRVGMVYYTVASTHAVLRFIIAVARHLISNEQRLGRGAGSDSLSSRYRVQSREQHCVLSLN